MVGTGPEERVTVHGVRHEWATYTSGQNGPMRPYDTLTTTGQARRHRRTVLAALSGFGVTPVRIRQLAVDTNFVFRVDATDGRSYALRVQRPWGVDPATTELEIWFVEQLADRGLPVARPVRTPGGASTVDVPATPEVPEAHRCAMFEWLSGSDADDTGVGFWSQMGELAGRLHALSAELDIPPAAVSRRWDRVYYFGEELVTSSPVLTAPMRRLIDTAVTRLDAELAAIYARRSEPPFLVHGDLHDGNVRVRRSGLALFDFEDFVAGYGIHDLAVALYGPFYRRSDYDEVVAAMRAGYERHRPWPVDDPAELRTLFAARAVILVEYCLLMGPDLHEHLPMLVERLDRYLR